MENANNELAKEQSLPLSEENRKKQIQYLKISYVLLVLFPIASIVYCLICKNDLKNDAVLSSHCAWQIRTFCWCILGGGIVVFALIATLVGIVVAPFVGIGVGIWLLVRVIKGFTRLDRNEPIAA